MQSIAAFQVFIFIYDDLERNNNQSDTLTSDPWHLSIPGHPAGGLLWASDQGVGGRGVQAAGPPAADDLPGPD